MPRTEPMKKSGPGFLRGVLEGWRSHARESAQASASQQATASKSETEIEEAVKPHQNQVPEVCCLRIDFVSVFVTMTHLLLFSFYNVITFVCF